MLLLNVTVYTALFRGLKFFLSSSHATTVKCGFYFSLGHLFSKWYDWKPTNESWFQGLWLTVVIMKNMFRDVTPWSLVENCVCFGGALVNSCSASQRRNPKPFPTWNDTSCVTFAVEGTTHLNVPVTTGVVCDRIRYRRIRGVVALVVIHVHNGSGELKRQKLLS
jgi:hypothetical protein